MTLFKPSKLCAQWNGFGVKQSEMPICQIELWIGFEQCDNRLESRLLNSSEFIKRQDQKEIHWLDRLDFRSNLLAVLRHLPPLSKWFLRQVILHPNCDYRWSRLDRADCASVGHIVVYRNSQIRSHLVNDWTVQSWNNGSRGCYFNFDLRSWTFIGILFLFPEWPAFIEKFKRPAVSYWSVLPTWLPPTI